MAMRLTTVEAIAMVHGMLIGGAFLLAFSGGLLALHGLRSELLTAAGVQHRIKQLKLGTSVMALMAWATVLTGTWVILPWYRAASPDSPKSKLLADPATRQWHEFADLWKTHLALMSPLLATAAAALVLYYGRTLARDRSLRSIVLVLLVAAFAVSSIAALIGALVTRVAPVH
jgi:hypothetical protein